MKYVVLLLLCCGLLSSETKSETFTGEIADSSCAYNVHSLSRSHKEMLKSKAWGKTPTDCTRRCVKQFGAAFVLVHDNDVYRLEQQNMADTYAGQSVRIVGTLSEDGKTIHIDNIEPMKQVH